MQIDSIVINVANTVASTARSVTHEQLSAATPCNDWDVRTLANHLLQVISALNLAGHGEDVPDELWARDLMSDAWVSRFDDEARQATVAWTDPAAPEGMISLGSAKMPASFVATMLASDLVIHGWDLARATGQGYRCDEDAAEMTYRFIAETGAQGREMGIFAAPVPVADAAPILERALGLSGRDPKWASPR